MADRDEARYALVMLLMEKVRQDTYPSTTMMSMIEEMLPRSMFEDYQAILLEKVAADRFPSIPMMRRIQAVSQLL